MYKRNLKYFKNNYINDLEKWEIIPDNIGNSIIDDLENHAKEKGFDINSFMEFVKENVIYKVNKVSLKEIQNTSEYKSANIIEYVDSIGRSIDNSHLQLLESDNTEVIYMYSSGDTLEITLHI